jgi:hypothetical protein
VSRFQIDGQRPPREPSTPIDILDSVGLDRRMTPQPLVFESTERDWFEAVGEWLPTQPMPLRDE